MPLVAAKCTNCGANLEVDNTKDAAICPYCGTPYVVEKAINYYNNANNITTEVVNGHGGNSADFVIRAGELMKYNGEATDIVIPNSVTMVGNSAFEDCHGLTSVIIPNGVTSIGEAAFAGCNNLRDITIPDSVTSIGGAAFFGCSNLHDITIPSGVSSISPASYRGCLSLNRIIIPANVTEIGASAFCECRNLFDVKFEVGLKKILTDAFRETGIKQLIIPESVELIDDGAFRHCVSLEKVVLPSHKIGIVGDGEYKNAAFLSCSSLVEVVNGDSYDRYCFLHTPYEVYLQQQQAQSQQKAGGCYIATSVYGSYDCPSVWTLRRYRDNTLAKSLFGRLFIRCYYAISPTVVRIFGKQRWFNYFWKKRLDKLVGRLQGAGYDDSPYTDC